jgi:hypothetical protein
MQKRRFLSIYQRNESWKSRFSKYFSNSKMGYVRASEQVPEQVPPALLSGLKNSANQRQSYSLLQTSNDTNAWK